ncbi:hypothetical protein ACFL10_02255 [Patescibacteria group bacterium]
MKKILIYISALITIFAVGAMIGTSYAASGSGSPIEELVAEAKKAKREAVAQDMYLDVYLKINAEPAKKAAKESAKKFKMSEEEMNKLMKEGDITSIKGKDENQDLKVLQKKYTEIFANYHNTLATENLRADLESKVSPSEIFTNGDTSDSDFDLLYDLTVIEVILFNKASFSSFGGQFQMPDFDFTDKDEADDIAELFGFDEEDEDALDATSASEERDFSALACLEDDSNLSNALDDFDAAEADREAGLDDDEAGLEEIELDEDGFPIAPSDDWLKKYLCPDGAFFCIEVTFDLAASSIYGKTDNCVACHVQYLNKDIDKMLSKPMSANKMAGNLFEVPKCKSSFTSIGANMNVITIAVPPPKQARTDMYTKINIDTEWKKFQEKYIPYFYDAGDTELPDQNDQDRASRKAVTNSTDSASLQEIVAKTEEVIQGVQAERIDDQEKKNTAVKAQVQNKEFQTLIEELDGWKTYFSSIKTKFDEMIEECNGLANKAYCS